MDSAGTIRAVLCTFVSLWGMLEGRIYNNLIPVAQHVHCTTLMDRGFGFLSDGVIHFSMSCKDQSEEERPDFWLLFCSTADAREFTSYYSQTTECQRFLQARTWCERHRLRHNASGSVFAQEQYHFTHQMESGFFTLILLQCISPEKEITNNFSMSNVDSCPSTLIALNPGNVQLSSDEIPLPIIYTIINLFWATLVGAWFFNWVIYFKFSNRLHQLISCAPIFKVILVVLVLLWWQEISNTGIEPSDISSIRVFVKSVEDSLLFITMMIIAEGWGVIRCRIKHYRWTSLILLFLLFASSLMCVHWVHRYFLAFSVCCVVFIMYKTLKWTSQNIELLRRRRRKIRRFISRHNLRYKGIVTLDMQLMQKLGIYQKFRVVCAIFSMVYAIVITLATFLNYYTDIKALTFEIPKLLVYTSIGVIFRLRNFEPYESIELVPPKENVVVIELPDVCFGQVDPHVTLGIPLHFKVEKETQTPRRRWRAPIM